MNSRASVGTNTPTLINSVDLSTLRTTDKSLCQFVYSDEYYVQICQALVVISLKNQLLNTVASADARSLLFFRREYLSYTYFDLLSNVTMKNLFLESFVDECSNCSLVLDPAVMIKLCTSLDCAPQLTNNSISPKTTLVIIGAFKDPFILWEGQLLDLKLFIEGIEQTAASAMRSIEDGSTGSKYVSEAQPDQLHLEFFWDVFDGGSVLH